MKHIIVVAVLLLGFLLVIGFKTYAKTNMIVLEDSQGTDDGAQSPIYGGSAGSGETFQAHGQSFVAGSHSEAYTLEYITLRLFMNNTITDGVYIEVLTGSISGTVIATSETLTATSISHIGDVYSGVLALSNSPNNPIFNFSGANKAFLVPETQYFIRLQRTGTRDTTNYIGWFHTNPGSALLSNGFYQKDNTVWGSQDTRDHAFEVWGSPFSADVMNNYQFVHVGDGMSNSGGIK